MTGSITADRVSKTFGNRLVLDEVSCTVSPGRRLGVVGRNGVGKTTLLRILAGLEQPDSGEVRHPPQLTIGYLPQEVTAEPGETLRGYLGRRTGVSEAEREVAHLAEKLAKDPGLAKEYSDALARMVALGAGDLESRAAAVVEQVGLGGALDTELAALSGGESARAALAAILLSRFDVLLVDEPTNNLDFAGLRALEDFISETPAGVVVVSHDRVFLERTVTHVLEIDHGTHRGTLYSGGWQVYLTERERARERQYERHEQYVTEYRRIQDTIRTKREWARKGAIRAKTRAPDHNKAARHGRRESAENLAGGNRALERRLERLEQVDEPYQGWRLHLTLGAGERSGDQVAQLRDVVVDRGRFRLGPVNLDLRWRDRVALLGPNGSGKTTLLSVLLGELTPTSGEVRLGSNVRVGRLDQYRALFEGERQVLEAVRTHTGLPAEEARALLAKFDLGAELTGRPVNELSPGERTRAELALLMAARTNLLVLDEPTNHLDLPAIEQLEAALPTFPGTLLVVSHDRRFLAGVDVQRRIDLEVHHEGGTKVSRLRETIAGWDGVDWREG